MTEQTKAQRLANVLKSDGWPSAATELRRLDANEAALVEALKQFRDYGYDRETCIALITRIEAERNAK